MKRWNLRVVQLGSGALLAIVMAVLPLRAFSADRLVFVDYFTATWCGPCGVAAPALGQLLDDFPDDFVLMEVHLSDNYSIPWGQSNRWNYYPGSSIPNVWFDGVVNRVGASTIPAMYNSYNAVLQARAAVPTDVSIDLSAVQTDVDKFDVTTTVSIDPGGSSKTLRLYLAELLDHYPSNPSYYRNTLKQSIEPGFDVTLNAGDSTQFTRSVTLDATSMSRFEDVKMVAWAQTPNPSGPAAVFNAAQYYLDQPVVNGDFNGDGAWDCVDIDELVFEIAEGTNGAFYDMNGDGAITLADITDVDIGWLAVGGANNPAATGGNPFLVADANLDGVVDGQDFIKWNDHKFTSIASWCSGDFTADGVVDGQDFIKWNENKFTSSDSQAAVVPEPTGLLLLACSLIVLVIRRTPA